jgi:hypothetical protein
MGGGDLLRGLWTIDDRLDALGKPFAEHLQWTLDADLQCRGAQPSGAAIASREGRR